MELIHPAIKSSIFKHCDTYEIDIYFKGKEDEGDEFSLRIELFRSLTNKKLFRYRAWRNEFFRIQSTFPQSNSGNPKHEPSDETILVGFSQPYFESSKDIRADSASKALKRVIQELGKSLEHITSKSLKIK